MLRIKQGIFSGVTLRDIGVTSHLWFCRNHIQMGGVTCLRRHRKTDLFQLMTLEVWRAEGTEVDWFVRSLTNDQVATTCWELCWGLFDVFPLDPHNGSVRWA